jgi:hypothetical protein
MCQRQQAPQRLKWARQRRRQRGEAASVTMHGCYCGYLRNYRRCRTFFVETVFLVFDARNKETKKMQGI